MDKTPLRKKAKAQYWLALSLVPVVPGLKLRLGGCSYGGGRNRLRTSCYRGAKVIGWQGPLKTQADREDLMHEAGHAFLNELAQPLDIWRLKRLCGVPGFYPTRWSDMPDPNPATSPREPFEEIFADLYSDLSMVHEGYPALREFLDEIARRPPRR